jgi:hypothetical protein
MATDIKNITRLDLQDIYDEIQRQSYIQVKVKPDMHEDDFAISDQEIPQIHSFAMDACAEIANDADLVKHYTETGLDALTYYAEWEDPDTYDPNDTGELTSPNDQEISTDQIVNRQHNEGEKLDKGVPDYVIFSIQGLDDEQIRYTMVQQFIRRAIVNYVLREWWKLKGLYEWASVRDMDYQASMGKVRFNAITSAKNKTLRVRVHNLPGI